MNCNYSKSGGEELVFTFYNQNHVKRVEDRQLALKIVFRFEVDSIRNQSTTSNNYHK